MNGLLTPNERGKFTGKNKPKDEIACIVGQIVKSKGYKLTVWPGYCEMEQTICIVCLIELHESWQVKQWMEQQKTIVN